MSNFLRAFNAVSGTETFNHLDATRRLSNDTMEIPRVDNKANNPSSSSIMSVLTGTLALIISSVGLTIATESPNLVKTIFAVLIACMSSKAPILPVVNSELIMFIKKDYSAEEETDFLAQVDLKLEDNSADFLSGNSDMAAENF